LQVLQPTVRADQRGQQQLHQALAGQELEYMLGTGQLPTDEFRGDQMKLQRDVVLGVLFGAGRLLQRDIGIIEATDQRTVGDLMKPAQRRRIGRR
jgi:hypothetical protein